MSTRAAHRYAKAVLDLAIQTKKEEAVYKDMQLIRETLLASQELVQSLKSPIIENAQKKMVVEKVFQGKTQDLTTKLFGLLAENKRLDILPIIVEQYTSLFNAHKGIVKATVITAVPLDDAMTQKVMAKAKELVGNKQITLDSRVDESILGGFVLRVGDVQADTSIANQLKKLKRELVN
jgi:F-type H+-transporting ATPase subunit delta